MTDKWNYDESDYEDSQNVAKKSPKCKESLWNKSKSRSASVEHNYPSTNGVNVNESKEKTSNNSHSRTNNLTPEPCTCIGIFGLSKKTDEKTLWKTFEKFGKIKTVNLIMDKFQNVSVGYAFINYEDISCATLAVKEANGINLDGKSIRVDYSITKKAYTPTPGGYKGKINLNYKNNFQNKRDFRRNGHAKSRSRSMDKRRSVMKCLNKRDSPGFEYRRRRPSCEMYARTRSPLNDFNRKRMPLDYQVRTSPGRNKLKRYSPLKYDKRDYSPLRKIIRRHSPPIMDLRDLPVRNDIPRPLRGDDRRYSPIRSSDIRRYSPARMDTRRHSPMRSDMRRHSPMRSEIRRHSPIRHETRRHSPMMSDVRRQSPMRSSIRRLSPMGYDMRRLSPMRSDIRRPSPIRSDVRRYSPATKRPSMRTDDFRTLSPNPNARKGIQMNSESKTYLGKHIHDNSYNGKSYPIRNPYQNIRSKSRSY